MRIVTVITLFALMLMPFGHCADKVVPTNKLVVKKVMTPLGALKPEDIKKMVASWVDPKSGSRYSLRTTTYPSSRMQTREKKKGKICFRVTASLYEYKKKSKYPKRVSATSRVYLLDSTGKMAFKRDVSLAKMCPS